MIDGICIMHSHSTYMFHHFFNPIFNDKDIQQRVNVIQRRINKQQVLKKKIEKDQITLYPNFNFIKPELKEPSISSGFSELSTATGLKETMKEAEIEQKLKNIDKLPREGVVIVKENLEYFGDQPKLIIWREFKGLIVAVISSCEEINIAHISVFITFVLKEVHRIREEELQQEAQLEEPLYDQNGTTLSIDESLREQDLNASQLNENWTGLPKEEKIIELLDKLVLREYSSGLLPFYTIDFFKFKLNESSIK